MNPAQQEWLDGLICERLSATEANDSLRLDFENERVESLVDFIAGPDTFEKDKGGDIAVYVIKERDEIIAFFSLQCGNIFEKVIKDEDMRFYELFQAFSKGRITPQDYEELMNYQAVHNLSDEKMKLEAEKIELRIREVGAKKSDDALFEQSDNVNLVHRIYPAIEVVHFCRNDNYSGHFSSLFPGQRLGQVLFMRVIVPELRKIRSAIGCKFIYLFAVTNERDNKLVAHYTDNYGFRADPGYGVSKALHESGCLFMAQSIDQLFSFARSFDPSAPELAD